jgi:hypothetical protein
MARGRAAVASLPHLSVAADNSAHGLPPPAERDEWQNAQQHAASQRLAVITGTHPHAFPNLGDPDQAWAWYRDNNPYATGALAAPPRVPVAAARRDRDGLTPQLHLTCLHSDLTS